jgi:pimeloyl-ACP methyl ester carboxylesterase
MPTHSRLARRLQLSCAVVLTLAAGWVAWRWPRSPLQATVGAALILAVPSLVLALELVLARRVTRPHPAVPMPSTAELLRAWWSEVRHFHRAFCWRQPFRWRAVGDSLDPRCDGRTGVVLVHGLMCNRGFWLPWLRQLRQLGRPCVAINLEPVFGSIDAHAAAVEAAVRRLTELTGCPPILVGHSMGGLVIRAWWRAHGGRGRIAHVVTIAAPHAGTWLARFSKRTNGRQMRLRSGWLQGLAADEQRRPLPPATCWFSNCDNVVFPAATATLPGADNRFLPGEAHVALAFHPAVFRACVELLDRADEPCQGESVTGMAHENG